ncbi:MAG: hypothetical protein LDL56_12305 [Armatimonadetes bacterium]|jgi:hypothetical protein|uniref:hypothetical protein n=1 Tax=Elioraea tepidiphila TaxID=457934 RepID=UPI0003644FA0|nr:hypothetical protein [Elioraea tepidiphila]MCA1997995.1 hypothetical protein [Armatimonadota bacterium]
MNLSTRSRMSLIQFLRKMARQDAALLLMKYGIVAQGDEAQAAQEIAGSLTEIVLYADMAALSDLVQELARTHDAVRSTFQTKYVHDQWWAELERSLALDGYAREPGTRGSSASGFVPIDPAMAGTSAPDDLLTSLLREAIPDAPSELSRLIDQSAEAFIRGDWNGSLTSARVFLQNLARRIAEERNAACPRSFNPAVWGQVAAYLRTSGFIDEQEERGICGAFSFASIGGHNLIGLTEEEFAVFGRTMAFRASYFLLKRLLGSRALGSA